MHSVGRLFWACLAAVCVCWYLSRRRPVTNTVPLHVPAHAPVPAPVPAPEPPMQLLRTGTTTSMRTSELCTFMADAGLVCPLQVDEDEYMIRPYQHCSPKIQDAVSAALGAEWQQTDDVEYTDAGIRKAWPGGDVLYVAAAKNAELFLGCIAVDRRNFHPFISHLLVTPSARGRGYGSRLLKLGEDYARCLRMESVKLWCKPHMVPFYEGRGYVFAERRKSDIIVMSKDLLYKASHPA